MNIREQIELFGADKFLEYNSKLQKKKNNLRKALEEKGVLKKEAENKFDKYTYFSEAQYKSLFTELFSKNDLELKFSELDYAMFTGSEKQSNGRMPKLCFTLFDCETGFFEDTVITGEAIDKGDKAGYKAYTGALKYYLANTFMVATNDEAKKDNQADTINKGNEVVPNKNTEKNLSEAQIKRCYAIANNNGFSEEDVKKLVQSKYQKELKNFSYNEYQEFCTALEKQADKLKNWINKHTEEKQNE